MYCRLARNYTGEQLHYRQHIIPPFKRKDVSYTYRFEQFVLRSLIGSTVEEVARRLGIRPDGRDPKMRSRGTTLRLFPR